MLALGWYYSRFRAGSRTQKSEIQGQLSDAKPEFQGQLGAGTLDGLNGVNPIH
jgi:hypothetical protein